MCGKKYWLLHFILSYSSSWLFFFRQADRRKKKWLKKNKWISLIDLKLYCEWWLFRMNNYYLIGAPHAKYCTDWRSLAKNRSVAWPKKANNGTFYLLLATESVKLRFHSKIWWIPLIVVSCLMWYATPHSNTTFQSFIFQNFCYFSRLKTVFF